MTTGIDLLFSLVKAMHSYQKENGITKECCTNVQYLIDQCRSMFLNKVEARPVFMTYIENEECKVWNGHVILYVEGVGLLDPSYETSHLQNTNYFGSITDLLSMFPSIKEDKQFCLSSIQNYLTFQKLADKINTPSKCIIITKEYYHSQHDYVVQQLKHSYSSIPIVSTPVVAQ